MTKDKTDKGRTNPIKNYAIEMFIGLALAALTVMSYWNSGFELTFIYQGF